MIKNVITISSQKDRLTDIEKFIAKNPFNPVLFIRRGDFYQKKLDTLKAKESYIQAIDLMAEQGFTKKAMAVLNVVKRIDPADITIKFISEHLSQLPQ